MDFLSGLNLQKFKGGTNDYFAIFKLLYSQITTNPKNFLTIIFLYLLSGVLGVILLCLFMVRRYVTKIRDDQMLLNMFS